MFNKNCCVEIKTSLAKHFLDKNCFKLCLNLKEFVARINVSVYDGMCVCSSQFTSGGEEGQLQPLFVRATSKYSSFDYYVF